jgi:hypothetical protein
LLCCWLHYLIKGEYVNSGLLYVSQWHIWFIYCIPLHSLRMLLCPVIPISLDKTPSSLPYSWLWLASYWFSQRGLCTIPAYIPTSALKVDTACFSKTVITTYMTTWSWNSEVLSFHCLENHKSFIDLMSSKIKLSLCLTNKHYAMKVYGGGADV